MNRARIGILSLGLVTGLALIAASCGGNQGSASVPAPVASVAPTAAPAAVSSAEPADKGPDLNDPKEVTVSSWTDDDAIAALAKDCRWDPGNCIKTIEAIAPNSMDGVEFLPEGSAMPEGDTRVLPADACRSVAMLACAQVPSQSCAPDACSQTDYDCIPECDKSCVSCAGACVTSCESCKAPCKDDACRLACARSCGECRSKCVQALDHCASATCSEKMETCFRERDDAWNSSTCPKVCPKVQDCVEKCPEIENDYTGQLYVSECANKCLKRLGKGCPESFYRICAGDPNASVNFNAYHFNRQNSK